MSVCMVATDGSQHADHALTIASSLAKTDNSKLILVHVVSHDEPPTSVSEGMQVEFGRELETRLSSSSEIYKNLGQMPDYGVIQSQHAEISRVMNTIYGEQLLKHAKDKLRELGHESVESLLLEGDPADQLVAQAREHRADMVVMGCRGLGRLKSLFGSVSQQVAHELDCRVVLVK
ncbi:MAG: universal stress protein [Granulosicoccus sp.]|nr:universal stress protein [Granulosicoccus sp.]